MWWASLYAKDTAALCQRWLQRKDFDIKELLHEPFYIPETAKCTELFKDFQRKQLHMAIVIDEIRRHLRHGDHGGPAGDHRGQTSRTSTIRKKTNTRSSRTPSTPSTAGSRWDEVEDLLDIKIPDDTEYDTLGGVVVVYARRPAEEGEHPLVQIDRVALHRPGSGTTAASPVPGGDLPEYSPLQAEERHRD